MKLTPTAKRAISAMLIFLLMAGLYGAIVALCNQYLREHDMLTRSSKFILGVFMFAVSTSYTNGFQNGLTRSKSKTIDGLRR